MVLEKKNARETAENSNGESDSYFSMGVYAENQTGGGDYSRNHDTDTQPKDGVEAQG